MDEISTEKILKTVLDGMQVLIESTDKQKYTPRNPYAAFILGSVCIELMGRCLRDGDDWMSDELDATGQFNNALRQLNGLSNYKNLIELWKYDKNADAQLDKEQKKLLTLQSIVSKSAEYEAAKSEASTKFSESKSANVKRDDLYKELNDLRKQAGLPAFDKGFSLFKALRCGFAHTCRPKTGLLLTNSITENGGVSVGSTSVTLGVKELYDNLILALDDLRSKGKHIDDPFIYVTEKKI